MAMRDYVVHLDATRAAYLDKMASRHNIQFPHGVHWTAADVLCNLAVLSIDTAAERTAYEDARATMREAADLARQGYPNALHMCITIAADSRPDATLDAATWQGYRDELRLINSEVLTDLRASVAKALATIGEDN